MTFASDTKSNKIQLKRKIKIKKKDNVSKNQNKTDPDRLLHVDVAWDLFIRNKGSYVKYVMSDGWGSPYNYSITLWGGGLSGPPTVITYFMYDP